VTGHRGGDGVVGQKLGRGHRVFVGVPSAKVGRVDTVWDVTELGRSSRDLPELFFEGVGHCVLEAQRGPVADGWTAWIQGCAS
jgi:hypothetical protein